MRIKEIKYSIVRIPLATSLRYARKDLPQLRALLLKYLSMNIWVCKLLGKGKSW
jgi:hypothetical protein